MASKISKTNSENYDPVPFEDEPWLEDASPEILHQRSWILRISIPYMVYLFTAGFLVLTGFVMGSSLYPQAQEGHSLSIFNNVHFDTEQRRFNGSFFRRSHYSGPPNLEMDKAWARFTETGGPFMPDFPAFLSISASDAHMSTGHSLETAVRLNGPTGEGYMASLEIFHHLHCLNYIRRFIYLDYYEATDPKWAGKISLREHADHCVDMLREVLMCQSDTSLITYHWIKGYPGPAPDFSTSHSCRDPDAVRQWMKDNEVHISHQIKNDGQVAELPEIF